MTIDEPFNPLIHRIKGAIKERAVHPSGPVPPTPATLTKFSGPPEDVVESAKPQIDSLIQAAEVKKGIEPRPPSLSLPSTNHGHSTTESKGPPPERNRKTPLRPRH